MRAPLRKRLLTSLGRALAPPPLCFEKLGANARSTVFHRRTADGSGGMLLGVTPHPRFDSFNVELAAADDLLTFPWDSYPIGPSEARGAPGERLTLKFFREGERRGIWDLVPQSEVDDPWAFLQAPASRLSKAEEDRVDAVVAEIAHLLAEQAIPFLQNLHR